MFRPVAIIIVGKQKLMHLDQYWGNNLYGLRSEIIYSLPADNSSLKRNALLSIKLPWFEWSLWRIQNALFTLTRAYKCKLWTTSFLRLLGSNWTLFWRMFMTNQSCKRQKQSSALLTASSQMRIKMSNSKNSQSQFWQCRNSALPHPLLSPWAYKTLNVQQISLTTIELIGTIEIISMFTTHHKQLDKQWVLCFTDSFTTLKIYRQSITFLYPAVGDCCDIWEPGLRAFTFNLIAWDNYIQELYAVGFITGLRVIKMIKGQIQ